MSGKPPELKTQIFKFKEQQKPLRRIKMNSPIGTKTHHIDTEEHQQQRENAETVGVGMN